MGFLVCGGIGAVLRTAIGASVDARKKTGFPLGTFVVNVSGSFAAGVLYGSGIGGDAQLLTSVALVGAYSTFSTWMADTERLTRNGAIETALLNVFASLMVGFAFVLLGKLLGEALF